MSGYVGGTSTPEELRSVADQSEREDWTWDGDEVADSLREWAADVEYYRRVDNVSRRLVAAWRSPEMPDITPLLELLQAAVETE